MTIGYRVRCHNTGCEGEIINVSNYRKSDKTKYAPIKHVEYLVAWDHGLVYGVSPEIVDIIPNYQFIQTTADTRDLKRPIFERQR